MADRSFTCVVTAGGVGTVTIKPDKRMTWVVQQVSNEMLNAPGTSICAVRKNGFLISPLIAQADVAAGDPPVYLLPSKDSMTVIWTGATPGDIGTVFVTYEEQAP